jgi:iron(III) transport system substrate-binding protein
MFRNSSTKSAPRSTFWLSFGVAAGLLFAACAPAPPPAPTAAPPKPAEAKAPDKAAEAAPAAKPAAKEAAPSGADAELAQLIEGAKKEGELHLYSVQSGDDLKRSDPEFQQLYPFIKMNRYREDGEVLGAKLMAEARAGTHIADILDVAQEVMFVAAKAGLLAEYEAPERQTIDAKFKHQFFTNYRIQTKPISYNTRLLSKDQAPKGYDELLDQKWKGKLVMEPTDASVFAGTIQLWGEEKALQFWRGVTANGLQFRAGQTQLVQLLAAGEFPVAVAANLHTIEQEKPKGAPLDWVNTKPLFSSTGAVAVTKNAQHPNAARLWVRYQLSKNGQEAVADTGRVPVNPAVPPKHQRLKDEGFDLLLSGNIILDQYERLNKLFFEVTGRPVVK